ncbi:hypothetical protein [Gracilibacillus suaedae]|uniref:hypothetical protein n=1 Tax=Gracilibacillus suaedae TaxID=2820273 RepID=UPI001ABE6310|nr:hypothetical protein [Gracilibacillus suaedae]
MAQFLLIAAIIFIIVHLIYFFRNKTYKKSYFSNLRINKWPKSCEELVCML